MEGDTTPAKRACNTTSLEENAGIIRPSAIHEEATTSRYDLFVADRKRTPGYTSTWQGNDFSTPSKERSLCSTEGTQQS